MPAVQIRVRTVNGYRKTLNSPISKIKRRLTGRIDRTVTNKDHIGFEHCRMVFDKLEQMCRSFFLGAVEYYLDVVREQNPRIIQSIDRSHQSNHRGSTRRPTEPSASASAACWTRPELPATRFSPRGARQD